MILQHPIVARVALVLNVAGTVLLALSFQATSSDFVFVTAPNTDMMTGKFAMGNTTYAICVNDHAMAATTDHGGLGMGLHSCPTSNKAYPAAVVIA